jgi:predicted alpha/beta hydrolase
VAERDLTVPAADGLPLTATLFEPADPTHAVIVSCATATPRGFYRAFAAWLASRGAAVLTYDYRGTGATPDQLRRSNARMRDWGALDFPGVVAWMRERYPQLPPNVVGHSFGGHALLMAPNCGEIARSVLVAAQSGYWRLTSRGERLKVWALINLVAPFFIRTHGYVPGSNVGLGEDFAKGIMLEWRGWCNTPNYFYDDPTMEPILANGLRYTAPTLMLGLTDDVWATPAAIDWLARRYTHAPVERRTLDPQAFGLDAVGHMGFFRSRNGEALWPVVAAHLGLMEDAA